MARYRLAPAARSDVMEILAHSHKIFGLAARRRYRGLLEAAFSLLAEQPGRLGTLDRSDLGAGCMQFHLRLCPPSVLTEGRVRQPRHAIYFRVSEPGLIDILRVLHDRMDPHRHVDNDN